MKTTPSAVRARCRPGSPPRRPDDHQRPRAGQGGAHPGEGLDEAVDVLARLERADAEEELAAHGQAPEERVGCRRVGVGQVVGAAGHDGDPPRVDAERLQVRGHQPGRDDDGRRAVADPSQRGLVPAQPTPRRGLGRAAPGEVVDRDDQPAPAGAPRPRRGERHRMHDVEPLGRVRQPVVPRPRQERPRQPGRHAPACRNGPTGPPPDGSRRPAAPGATGQERHVGPLAVGGALGQAAEEPPGVDADAAGHPTPELLDDEEHGRAGVQPPAPPAASR